MPGVRGPSDYSKEPPRHPCLQINSKVKQTNEISPKSQNHFLEPPPQSVIHDPPHTQKQHSDVDCGQEPALYSVLSVEEPFNAEPPRSALISSYITPVDLFYKRNHGPIPIVDDIERYRVSIDGLIGNPKELSMADIRKLPKYEVTATLQCAGNRRTAMSKTRTVKGVGWDVSAIGNAIWGGAKLSDVLELVGIPKLTAKTPSGGKHVEFISVDRCKEENGGPYKASIPLNQATNPDTEVLLAYEMNGEANKDKTSVIVPKTIHWNQVTLPVTWQVQSTPRRPPPSLLSQVLTLEDGTVELQFSESRKTRLQPLDFQSGRRSESSFRTAPTQIPRTPPPEDFPHLDLANLRNHPYHPQIPQPIYNQPSEHPSDRSPTRSEMADPAQLNTTFN